MEKCIKLQCSFAGSSIVQNEGLREEKVGDMRREKEKKPEVGTRDGKEEKRELEKMEGKYGKATLV